VARFGADPRLTQQGAGDNRVPLTQIVVTSCPARERLTVFIVEDLRSSSQARRVQSGGAIRCNCAYPPILYARQRGAAYTTPPRHGIE
jgi:hypothetical protein